MWRLTLLLLAASLCAQDRPIDQAIEALGRDDFAAAVPFLIEAAEAEPENPSIPFNLGFAYTQLGNDAGAIEAYERALEINPELNQVFLSLGVLLLRNDRAAEATPHLARALDARPDDPEILFFYAQSLAAGGQTEDAVEAFQRVAEFSPGDPAVWVQLGRVQADLDRVDDALDSYRKAAEIDPELRTQQLMLAEEIEADGGLERALEIYRDFLEVEPDRVVVRQRVGDLLLELERYAEAAAEFEKIVETEPTDAARSALAQAYALGEDEGRARAKWAEAVRANPNDPELRLRLGASLIQARQYPEAGVEYLTAVQLAPENAEAWTGLAFTLHQVENYPASLDSLDRAEALAPLKPASVYLRAITLDRLQLHEEAQASYQRFLSMGAAMEDEEWKSRQRLEVIARILDKK